MLTDREILANMIHGEISIKPFRRKNLGPNSYDITIGERVRSLKFNCETIDLTKTDQYNFLDSPLPYELEPGETIIFVSDERIGCKNETTGTLSPRSSLSRTGLIFQFSSLLDTGFYGILSGAIYNATHSTIIIPENLRVMQIMFDYNTGSLAKKYNERKWSKNTNQFDFESVKYKPDKEWEIKNEAKAGQEENT